MKVMARFTALMFVSAIAFMGLCGKAWADAADVAALIKNYNFTSGGTGSISAETAGANEVIVTGTGITGAAKTLIINNHDLNNVTIKWQTTLQGNGDMLLPGINSHYSLIALQGNCTFRVENGGNISTNGTGMDAIFTTGFDVIVAGGTVKSAHSRAIASEGTSAEGTSGNIVIDTGAVVEGELHMEAPEGNIQLKDTSALNGFVSLSNGCTLNGEVPPGNYSAYFYFYGNDIESEPVNLELKASDEKYLITLMKGASLTLAEGGRLGAFIETELRENSTLTIPAGKTLTIKDNVYVQQGAQMVVNGEFITDPDPGRVHNYGKVIVGSGGKITNRYRIYNYAGGVVENNGTIDTTQGMFYSAAPIGGNVAGSIKSFAWSGAPSVRANHYSGTFLMGGKPSYANASFNNITIFVGFEPEDPNLDVSPVEGRVYMAGPVDYSAILPNGALYNNNGGNVDCLLIKVDDPNEQYFDTAGTFNGKRFGLGFRGKAQEHQRGLVNKDFQWEVGPHSGTGRVMDFKTTEEQLDTCVPYVELTDNAVIYKSWLPREGKAVPMSGEGRARIRIYGVNGGLLYDVPDILYGDGEIVDGSIRLSEIGAGMTSADIKRIQVRFYSDYNGTWQRYVWNFIAYNGSSTQEEELTPNTQTTTSVDETREKVTIKVKTQDGGRVLPGLWHKIWLKRRHPGNGIRAAAGESYGPFGIKSQEASEDVVLNIDVNNLPEVDGTKSSERVPAGSYTIRFVYQDADDPNFTYVGETEAMELAGTAETPTTPSSGGGGGGCNAALGGAALALAAGLLRGGKTRKR
ncbi:MAG: hypothetical protein LBC93_02245 [Synergistaceae bacterium]|jgi:hypothetical protein|nr:hypothetical protein [Synergistaceae bacterium]